MDFELPEELRLFKESLRRFVNTELIPVERDTLEGEELKPEYRERFIASAKARGIVTEELSRSIALPARGEGITGPTVRGILYTLSGEMKEKYLMPVLRG